MNDLIDTTEMYLRTIYELGEEGVNPIRARIAERLQQSVPTVSQTIGRMQRDGLVHVADDRHLELTEEGRLRAMRVMRKHRLAERLLVDVIGLDLELVHDEACRWEHVMSEEVERRLVEILDVPRESPYGTPIPGLDELLAKPPDVDSFQEGVVPLSAVLGDNPAPVVLRRFAEPLQEAQILAALGDIGALPGNTVEVSQDPAGVRIISGGGSVVLSPEESAHVFVSAP